jgi:5-methylcytosine-specific restriction endonuclease McrA
MKANPVTADAVLRRKCRTAYQHHRQLAEKEHLTLDYAAVDLVKLATASPQCFYCHAPLCFGFEFDHVLPIGRTPQAHRLGNVVCACTSCNAIKGQMDGEEFTRFLRLLDGMAPRSAADIRRRLIAGGKRYSTSRQRRPAG